MVENREIAEPTEQLDDAPGGIVSIKHVLLPTRSKETCLDNIAVYADSELRI